MRFGKTFLKRVLSIPSVSYREERVRDFILGFAKRRAITATVGEAGNVYLTKGKIGKGEYVPCFVNHMDTVQRPQCEYVYRNERLPVKERKNAEGKTELYVEGFGIGGDDKAGDARQANGAGTTRRCIRRNSTTQCSRRCMKNMAWWFLTIRPTQTSASS